LVALSWAEEIYSCLWIYIPGYCIMRLDNIDEASKDRPGRSFSIMQWSLFATCVFFCSGHWYAVTFIVSLLGITINYFQRLCLTSQLS
jgi:hypothetical protein